MWADKWKDSLEQTGWGGEKVSQAGDNVCEAPAAGRHRGTDEGSVAPPL